MSEVPFGTGEDKPDFEGFLHRSNEASDKTNKAKRKRFRSRKKARVPIIAEKEERVVKRRKIEKTFRDLSLVVTTAESLEEVQSVPKYITQFLGRLFHSGTLAKNLTEGGRVHWTYLVSRSDRIGGPRRYLPANPFVDEAVRQS